MLQANLADFIPFISFYTSYRHFTVHAYVHVHLNVYLHVHVGTTCIVINYNNNVLKRTW